jgi:hypothetical protein
MVDVRLEPQSECYHVHEMIGLSEKIHAGRDFFRTIVFYKFCSN